MFSVQSQQSEFTLKIRRIVVCRVAKAICTIPCNFVSLVCVCSSIFDYNTKHLVIKVVQQTRLFYIYNCITNLLESLFVDSHTSICNEKFQIVALLYRMKQGMKFGHIDQQWNYLLE